MSTIQLLQITPVELANLITENVKVHFQEMANGASIEPIPKEIISRKEAADLFKVSLVTIHEWSNNGIIKPYKLGNRTYFKYSELLESLYKSNTH